MSPDAIIEQVWQLPWYQVLYVSLSDGLILLVKIWPVWVVLAGYFIYMVFKHQWECVWKPKREEKKDNTNAKKRK